MQKLFGPLFNQVNGPNSVSWDTHDKMQEILIPHHYFTDFVFSNYFLFPRHSGSLARDFTQRRRSKMDTMHVVKVSKLYTIELVSKR